MERLGAARDTQTAPLARRVGKGAGMRAELDPVLIHDRPGSHRDALPFQKRCECAAAKKTDLLTLECLGRCQALIGSLVLHVDFLARTERKLHPRENLWIDKSEHVRLILGRVDATCNEWRTRMVDKLHVVARTPRRCAKSLYDAVDRVEPKGAVAGRARVRSLAGCIPGHEWIDDGGSKVVA